MIAESTRLITHSGIRLSVRPVEVSDEGSLADLFHHVSKEDLRFRFLSSMKEVSSAQLRRMVQPDHKNVETYIAFIEDAATPVATAMLALFASGRSEVAITVRGEDKGRGIGYALLKYVSGEAKQRGMKSVESVESRSNHDALLVEHDLGFRMFPMEGDGTLTLVRKDF